LIVAPTIQRFVTGPIENNTYIVSVTPPKCIVIDPSSGCGEVFAYVDEHGLSINAIVLTHGHFDHIIGIPEIQKRFPATEVWVHPDEKPLLSKPEYNGSPLVGRPFAYAGPTRDLVEGEMELGGVAFRVLHIPGHSPGGCAFVIGGHCISGDSLFAGSIGRTDFPACDPVALIDNLKRKVLTLPEETVVYPGHGNRTTVGREKRQNPYLS
jgi:glyoxylase-like metal-dependent hydrolase (beta-lactamase superfamily II)